MAASSFTTGPVGTTCRFTAALRHVEFTQVDNPVMTDPLAKHLCGDAALKLAQEELQGLQAVQGSGKHLRVPMRTRILEDWLLADLNARGPKHGCSEIQVVSLGAGLDTRPWRLQFPVGKQVHWVCLDLPEVMTMKLELLRHAGAATTERATPARDGAGGIKEAMFPLQCSSWHGLALDLTAADLETGGLRAVLAQACFNPQVPTVWVLEAVLYYMPLPKAEALLTCLASLSAPSSKLIATCVDTELLEASRCLHEGHVFAGLWHFDCDELMASTAYQQHWRTVMAPRTTCSIGLEDYNADTYVALYGGAECAFVSGLATEAP